MQEMQETQNTADMLTKNAVDVKKNKLYVILVSNYILIHIEHVKDVENYQLLIRIIQDHRLIILI